MSEVQEMVTSVRPVIRHLATAAFEFLRYESDRGLEAETIYHLTDTETWGYSPDGDGVWFYPTYSAMKEGVGL